MKSNRILLGILLSIIVFPMFFIFVNINGMNNNQPITTEFKSELIHEGAPAIDWELEEIKSDTNYTFSTDFAGKVVMIDFFATWCGPCIAAMPLLGEVFDYFSSESDFVLMSISLDDPGFSESVLETFAATNNMDWLVFYDEHWDTAVYYLIEAIPTLLIFSKTHYIYFAEEGIESAQPLIDTVEELLDMNDNTDPIINPIDSLTISVLNNDFTIIADITEDYIRHVQLNLTMGEYQETRDSWHPTSNLVEFSFNIDPVTIYNTTSDGYTNATIDILVEDYVSRDSSESFTVDLLDLEDTSAPVITIDEVIETDGTLGQNVKIIATITDDLLLISKEVEIWIDGVLEDSKELREGTTTDSYYESFYSLDVSKKQELQIKVIAEDVSGKITVEEYIYTITGGAGITIPIIIGMIILGNILLIPLQRQKIRT